MWNKDNRHNKAFQLLSTKLLRMKKLCKVKLKYDTDNEEIGEK